MISYIIPHKDRPEDLALTLAAIERLGDHSALGGAEVIIADNASRILPVVPIALRSRVPIKLLFRSQNEGAASRNAAAHAADPRSQWLVMLDDDSAPVDTAFFRSLLRAAPDVGAITADIRLPDGRRESGGLPEVFIGCGVAIRTHAFHAAAQRSHTALAYDPAFHYYVEEYDLSARLLLAGYRLQFDPWFRVLHRKVPAGRDMNLILARLVRNNSWVAQRYAPEHRRTAELREIRTRYRAIAAKEHALPGYIKGLLDLRLTLRRQPRSPLPAELFDRFTGLAHARAALAAAWRARPFATARLVCPAGKNAWAVRQALQELGVVITDSLPADADVIATLSPGPMLDELERRTALWRPGDPRVIAPWLAATDRPTRDLSDILTGGRSPAPASSQPSLPPLPPLPASPPPAQPSAPPISPAESLADLPPRPARIPA